MVFGKCGSLGNGCQRYGSVQPVAVNAEAIQGAEAKKPPRVGKLGG